LIEAQLKAHMETNCPAATGGFFMNRAIDPTFPYGVQRLIAKTDAGLGVTRIRVQFDLFAVDPNGYGKVKELSGQVRDAIRTFTDDDLPYSYPALEMEMYDGDVNAYRVMVDAVIYHDERKTF
jgi:hypothetical protein